MGARDILEGADAVVDVDPEDLEWTEEELQAQAEWDHVLNEMEAEGEAETDAHRDALADWLLERLQGCEVHIAHFNEVATRRKEMIDTWAAGEVMAVERRASRFAEKLRMVIRSLNFGRNKSKKLPHGKVGTKEIGGGIEIFDQEKANAWAKAHNVELKVTPDTVLKTPLSKYVKDTGDVPDEEECGWKVLRAQDEIFWKTS